MLRIFFVVILLRFIVSLILEGAKLWLLVKPVKRIRQWRTRRKMRSWHEEHGGLPDEVREEFNSNDLTQEVTVSETTQSFLRGLAKVLAGVLVTKGMIDVGEASALQAAVEALAAGVIGVVAFYLSHKKHVA